MTWWEGTNLKALQKIWYKKLKQSGFNDIENTHSRWDYANNSNRFIEPDVRISTSPDSHRASVQSISERFDYYNRAGQFLHEYRFKTRTEKQIWKLHSEGVPIRKIAKELKLVIAGSQHSVHSIINQLKTIMKTWEFDVE